MNRTGELQKVLYEFFTPQGLILNNLQDVKVRVRGVHLSQEVLYKPEGNAQRIIKLMGERSRQLPEGNQPIGPNELLLLFPSKSAKTLFTLPELGRALDDALFQFFIEFAD